MKKEIFEVRIYKNRNNCQFELIPIKKNMTPKMLSILEDPKTVGLRLIVAEELRKMPSPKLKLSTELRKKKRKANKKWLAKKVREELLAKNSKKYIGM